MQTNPTDETFLIIQRFNEAFNTHNVDTIMSLMTDDCIFENTSPSPDGERYQGAKAIRAFWENFFEASPQAYFEYIDVFSCGDRGVVRWLYRWGVDREGVPGHIQGVDIFRVRDGQVCEKLSYVKG